MKIEGSNKTGGVKGPSKGGNKSAAGGASFSGLLGETDSIASEAAIASTGPTAPLDALLALQDMGGANQEETRRRAKKRGLEMLDVLDQVRLDLLTGGVAQSRLDSLQRLVTAQREGVMDPQLSAVLDEIELRVQVELAKFSMR